MSTHVELLTSPKNMAEEQSGVTVIIIIGIGLLLFILLFIFAKRQIMRFTLRSRRGPHIQVGLDASKELKLEIERRLDLIGKITCEPQLFSKTDPRYIVCPGQQIPAHYYRLKAVDDCKILENEITKQDNFLVRHPSENLRSYLLMTLADPLNGSGHRLLHQFCDLYEHARYDPNHFGDEEYQQYSRLLMKLVDAAKLLRSYNSSRKSSPNRTPQKKHQSQEKNRNLLDPTRLHPVPPAACITSEEILSMGLSRHEVNLRRLLAKCELMVKNHQKDDDRFGKYITSLEDMLQEVRGTYENSNNETLQNYQKRITAIKIAVGIALNQYETENDSQLTRQELLGVRQRNVGQTLGTDNDLDAVINYHENLQKKITDDMVSIAQSLKEQSEKANLIIKRDTEVVGQSTQLTDQNFTNLSAESAKLKEHSKRAWKCWMWVLLIIVMVVFVNMVLFMKVMKKRQ